VRRRGCRCTYPQQQLYRARESDQQAQALDDRQRQQQADALREPRAMFATGNGSASVVLV